jgi:membrane fusion protein
MSLFRPEVIKEQSDQYLGQIVLSRPLSSWMLVSAVCSVVLVLSAYLFFGHYTKRASTSGVLAPVAGLIRIHSLTPGVIVERRVEEDQLVHAGDILFVVGDERTDVQPQLTRPSVGADHSRLTKHSVEPRRVADLVEASLAQRVAMLHNERTQTEIVARQELSSTVAQLTQLTAERESALQELRLFERRIASAQVMLRQFRKLTEQSYFSTAAFAQKQDDLAALQGSYQTIKRTLSSLDRQIGTLQATKEQAPARLAVQIAGFAQREAALAQESAEQQAKGKVAIVAPVDGVVTGILAQPGTTIGSQVIATLIPKNSVLQANLYLPSRTVGFVKAGQQVKLRYQAFPYQKFGIYDGVVRQVSLAQIPPEQLPEALPLDTREGLYRVIVALNSQQVTTYGRPQSLKAGMTVDADILQDTRALYEWILEPLFSWSRKL